MKPTGPGIVALIVWTIWCAAAIGVLIASFAAQPEKVDSGASSLCLMNRLVRPHEPCALCGMTRAFCALSHGDWDLALGYNAGSPYVYGLFWALAFSAPLCARAWKHLARDSRRQSEAAPARMGNCCQGR